MAEIARTRAFIFYLGTVTVLLTYTCIIQCFFHA